GTVCVCFLFQAEDGIRDWSVTGVQTCALPISMRQILASDHSRRSAAARTVSRCCCLRSRRYWPSCRRGTVEPVVWSGITHHPYRSEERRVGKERRSPSAPCALSKEPDHTDSAE